MSLAALPDVNGDGFNDLAVGAPDANLHLPEAAASPCSTASLRACTSR